MIILKLMKDLKVLFKIILNKNVIFANNLIIMKKLYLKRVVVISIIKDVIFITTKLINLAKYVILKRFGKLTNIVKN